MGKRERNLKHALIKAENASSQIRSVDDNSFVKLFDEGYEFVVLYDFKTSIHPSMQHIMFPDLSHIERDFQKAYQEVLLRHQGHRIIFAQIDYFNKEEQDVSDLSNISILSHRRAQMAKRHSVTEEKQVGAIKIYSASGDELKSLPITDVTEAIDVFIEKYTGLVSSKTDFERKIRRLSGPTGRGFGGAIIKALTECDLNFPKSREVNFSTTNYPI